MVGLSLGSDRRAVPRRRVVALRAALVTAALMALPPAPLAAEAASPAPGQVRFDLPAQPLESALTAYAQVTRRQVLIDSELVGPLRSNSVQRLATPEEALRLLLEGTGLTSVPTSANAFTLARVKEPAGSADGAAAAGAAAALEARAPPGLDPALEPFEPFLASAQAQVHRALCGAPLARPGGYQLGLRIWFGAGGIVERVEIDRPSGAGARDEAVVEALRRVRVGLDPPAGLPAPIQTTIGSSPDATACPADEGPREILAGTAAP